MKKYLLAALLCVGAVGPSMATVTYFSENFADLSAWTPNTPSYASVSGNVLSFSQGNSGGDIYTTASFTGGFVNFDYLGAQDFDSGGYVGFSQGFPGNHTWLAGSSSSFVTPVTLINDDTWHHYSIALTGTGHIMLEQFASNIPGQALFRSLSVTDVADAGTVDATVPEPETLALMLTSLGLMAAVRRRKTKSV